MKTDELSYREITLNSRQLEVPREAYQRELNTARVHKIAAEFDERIANEPKVSCRNGHYYVFDGQHTIAARKHRNIRPADRSICQSHGRFQNPGSGFCR